TPTAPPTVRAAPASRTAASRARVATQPGKGERSTPLPLLPALGLLGLACLAGSLICRDAEPGVDFGDGGVHQLEGRRAVGAGLVLRAGVGEAKVFLGGDERSARTGEIRIGWWLGGLLGRRRGGDQRESQEREKDREHGPVHGPGRRARGAPVVTLPTG